jgi:hypothetical protein
MDTSFKRAELSASEARTSSRRLALADRQPENAATQGEVTAREIAVPDGEAEIHASQAARPAGGEPLATPTSREIANAALASETTSLDLKDTNAPGWQAVNDPGWLHPRWGMRSALAGSRESLQRQNERLDAEGLERIEDEADLADRIAHKLLVPVPTSAALMVSENLPQNHRYCRPWTAHFLADLARMHAAQFQRPLEVSSAVRTVQYQKRLMGTNGNAAAAEGDIVSPHLTGATIDIAKSGLSRQEIAWMRNILLTMEQAGKIDAEEEFQQACFHITVYKNYALSGPELRAAQPKVGSHRKSSRRSAHLKSAPQPPDASPETVAHGL